MLRQIWDIVKGTLAYSMYGHNGDIRACSFSQKGDFFATGGVDTNLLIWNSAFGEKKGETVRERGLVQSGHMGRTLAGGEEQMRKRTRVIGT